MDANCGVCAVLDRPCVGFGESDSAEGILRMSHMMRTVLAIVLLIGISGAAHSAEPSFDVASIKPSPAGTREGIAIQPGGRLVTAGLPLKFLIALAWHL